MNQYKEAPPNPGGLFPGVSDGGRTRDPQSHNLMLYQLSYAHHIKAYKYTMIFT